MAKIIFVAQPDRYGRFGHQTFSLLTPLLLAHYLDELFLPLKYEYFACKYNDVIDFSVSRKAASIVEGKVHFSRINRNPIDEHGNTKYDLSCASDFGELMKIVVATKEHMCDYVYLLLPFDQFPGHLLRLESSVIRSDIKTVFQDLFISSSTSTKKPRYAIHIRRGDVTPERFPHWFIPDNHYCRLIEAIAAAHSGDVSINVVTQGSITLESDVCKMLLLSGNLRIDSSHSTWTNDMEIDSIKDLFKADYIVGGLSSFSMLPAWIKHGAHGIVFRKNDGSEYPHPVRIPCEIYIDDDLCTMVRKIQDYEVLLSQANEI